MGGGASNGRDFIKGMYIRGIERHWGVTYWVYKSYVSSLRGNSPLDIALDHMLGAAITARST